MMLYAAVISPRHVATPSTLYAPLEGAPPDPDELLEPIEAPPLPDAATLLEAPPLPDAATLLETATLLEPPLPVEDALVAPTTEEAVELVAELDPTACDPDSLVAASEGLDVPQPGTVAAITAND